MRAVFGRTVHYDHDEDDPSTKGIAVVQTKLLTAEEVDGLPCGYELHEGVAKGIAAAPLSSAIAVKVIAQTWNHVEERRCRVVFGANASFRLARDPDTVYLPDSAFVRASRIKTRGDLTYPFEGPPDLAVEVRSPSDRTAELDQKMYGYLAAGTLLGWAVDPLRRIITVYRPDEQPVVLRGTDTLTAGDLIPEFSVSVADVFSLGGFFPE